MTTRLTKSSNKRLSGVCAGIAEYLQFDITMVRAAWAILTFASGFPGIILYLICAFVMPGPESKPAMIEK